MVTVARRKENLLSSSERISSETKSEVHPVAADIRKAEDCDRIIASAVERFGRLDILVNNDGAPPLGLLESFDDAAWAAAVDRNLMSVVRLSRAALPGMIERGRGWIITVISVASFTYSMGNVNYCATKAYQRVFSEALALEVAGTGVRVQALCPGFTHTEFHQRAGIDMGALPEWMWLDAPAVVDQAFLHGDAGVGGHDGATPAKLAPLSPLSKGADRGARQREPAGGFFLDSGRYVEIEDARCL